MNKYISFLVLLTLGLNSCDCTYSYSVYVENATGENLKVIYKRVASDIEEKISLPEGESKMIIKNVAFQPEGDCSGTTSAHCSFVAKYVKAFIRDSVQSKIAWCSEAIKFEKSDIQEGEFIIKYYPNDF